MIITSDHYIVKNIISEWKYRGSHEPHFFPPETNGEFQYSRLRTVHLHRLKQLFVSVEYEIKSLWNLKDEDQYVNQVKDFPNIPSEITDYEETLLDHMSGEMRKEAMDIFYRVENIIQEHLVNSDIHKDHFKFKEIDVY